MVVSLSDNFLDMLRRSLGSDYLIMPPSVAVWRSNVGARSGLAERLHAVPGVGVVSTMRYASASADGEPLSLLGVDPLAFPQVSSLNFQQGEARAAFEQLAKLKPYVLSWESLDEIFPLLESGEVHATPMILGYAYTYIDKGMKVGASWPKDGTVTLMDSLCIVKNNPTPAMADAYAQISLGYTVQKAYAEEIFFGTTNKTVDLTGLPAERTVYGDVADQLVPLDWEFIIKEQVNNTEKWNRILYEQ